MNMPQHTLAGLLPPPPAVGRRRIGYEIQVEVREGDTGLDQGILLSRIASFGPALDPRDPRARVLPCGATVSGHRFGAKIALPPITLGDGAPESLLALALVAEQELGDWVRHDQVITLERRRIQVSVSANDDLLPAIAGEFTRRCALGVAMILGLHENGIQVRPRRGRLEVCAPSAPDDRMAAAMTLIASSAMLLEEARWMAEALPRELLMTIEPAPLRYGNHLTRSAFGADLALFGRETPVVLDGATTTAQVAFEHLWERSRAWAQRVGLDSARVEDIIAGRVALAIDGGDNDAVGDRIEGSVPAPVDLTEHRSPRGIVVTPEWVTWDTVVWSCTTSEGQTVRAVVPRELSEAFLEAVDTARFEDIVRQEVRRGTRRRKLVDISQAAEPGIWHEVNPIALLPLERNGIGQVPLSPQGHPRRGPQVPRVHAGPARRRGSRGHLSPQTGH